MKKSNYYYNPIPKAENVTIPTWEYADLIQHKTTLAVIVKLAKGLDNYKMYDVLKVLCEEEEGYA